MKFMYTSIAIPVEPPVINTTLSIALSPFVNYKEIIKTYLILKYLKIKI